MKTIVSGALVFTFLLLAGIHAYWALGGDRGNSVTVPQLNNVPLFHPSHAATALVAIALFACALLIAASGRLVSISAPRAWVAWPCYALALLLLVRAIGDFRYLGFFKTVHDSRFAWFDTILYSPLCLVLAVGVFFVTYEY